MPARLRHAAFGAGLALACDSSTAPTTPTTTSDSGYPSIAEKIAHAKKLRRPFDCAEAIERLGEVEGDDFCEQDHDCAEVTIEVCPAGPQYVHRDTDLDAMLALRRRVVARCKVAACDPAPLGIASCKGRCVRGRPAPAARKGRTCWHYEDRHVNASDAAEATTATLAGGVPRFSVVAVGASTLRLAIDWPPECDDCRLSYWVGEHARDEATAAVAVRTENVTDDARAARREHFELTAPDAAALYFVPWSGRPVQYRMALELLDATGHPGAVSRHGVSWGTECEAIP